MKGIFKPSVVIKEYSEHYPEMGKKIHELYNLLIDCGGHPNERSITWRLNVRIPTPDNKTVFEYRLASNDYKLIRFGIIKAVEVGLSVVRIFCQMDPEVSKQIGVDTAYASMNRAFVQWTNSLYKRGDALPDWVIW